MKERKQRVVRLRCLQLKQKATLIIGLNVMLFRFLDLGKYGAYLGKILQ